MGGVGSTVVLGIRVPRQLKEELERLGIDYAKEVREFLARRVREERARRLREEAEALAREIGRLSGNYAAEFVREVRDER
ncbi:type II toxin-antitoxin system VapB family antitoxin [Infirmifilum sp. SLHALR2]